MMYLPKQFFTLAMLLISIYSLEAMSTPRPNVPCPRCSDVKDVTWATDGRSCFVFRNSCYLLSANCGRSMEGNSLLKKIEKSECQKMCRVGCTKIGPSVCATCNNKRRTFGNKCMLTNHVCRTGEICDLYRADQGCENVAE